jgi:hypothetical protein
VQARAFWRQGPRYEYTGRKGKGEGEEAGDTLYFDPRGSSKDNGKPVRRACVGRVGRVSVGRVSVGRVSVGRVSVGRVSVGRVSVGRVSVGRVSVGRVSVGR